jgi:hypothetical protein
MHNHIDSPTILPPPPLRSLSRTSTPPFTPLLLNWVRRPRVLPRFGYVDDEFGACSFFFAWFVLWCGGGEDCCVWNVFFSISLQ